MLDIELASLAVRLVKDVLSAKPKGGGRACVSEVFYLFVCICREINAMGTEAAYVSACQMR